MTKTTLINMAILKTVRQLPIELKPHLDEAVREGDPADVIASLRSHYRWALRRAKKFEQEWKAEEVARAITQRAASDERCH